MPEIFGIDYATLWYLVIGGIFTGYAILDGFDLGAGAWHLFLRTDEHRRIALNAVGPVWDGNEVWLVIGGGALFAGFPAVYATLLSSMYIPFMLFLSFLIFRAVSIEFRSKEPMKWWRQLWDILYSFSSIALSFLLGIVLGNVLQGWKIDAHGNFFGNWFSFINPFSLLVGFSTLFLFMLHGAIYLIMKTEGVLYLKFRQLVKIAIGLFIFFFVISTLYSFIQFPHLTDRFRLQPVWLLVVLMAFLSIANIPRLIHKSRYVWAFIFSSLSVASLLMIVAIGLYPSLLYSTLDPAYSLTIANSSSSPKSLQLLLTIAAIGTPLVASYTAFVFWTFRGKVKIDETSY